MDPLQIKDRFPGVNVTLDETMLHPFAKTSNLPKSKTDPLLSSLEAKEDNKSKTDPLLSSLEDKSEYMYSRLPPAVANVPRDDWKSYVHSKKVNNYLIGTTLGEGSFAKVKEAFHVLVGEKVAMKIIDKKKALQDPYVAKNFKREARLLQKLRHPNIMKLYEVIETENNYYLITELCSGGELMKHIYKVGSLSEEDTRKYVRQLVSAVDHLHKAGLIHRDLKVENLLLDNNKDLKLIDFGLSNEMYFADDSGTEVRCRTQCGSPAYAAPELLGHKEYDQSVDVWSIGVNMYAMLTGCLPFTVEPFNITALHAKMLQNKMNPIPNHISKDCEDLLKKLLTSNPEERITLADVFSHPWLSKGHQLQFQPAPYPNLLTQSQINSDVVDHIIDVLHAGTCLEIKQDLLSNRATSISAIYHLLCSRLARYEKEFPSKITRQRTRTGSLKKKVSKDQGFYEAEDNDVETSSVMSVPVRSGTRGKQRSRRPVSEEITGLQISANVYKRRLSEVAEERRSSVPPDVLRRDLEKVSRAKDHLHVPAIPTNRSFESKLSHHRPIQPSSHSNNLSPPIDPYEFDYHHPNSDALNVPVRKKSPYKFPGPPVTNAWNSNPPSRAGSRANLYHKLPSINLSSPKYNEDEDLLDFHDVSSPTSPSGPHHPPTFTVGSNHSIGSSTPPNLDSGNVKKRATSFKNRRNGITIPPSGDLLVRTDLSVSALYSEILRAFQSINVTSVEPESTAKIKCVNKSVEMSVSIRKKSTTNCCLHFEWLSGGNYKLFTETCQDMMKHARV